MKVMCSKVNNLRLAISEHLEYLYDELSEGYDSRSIEETKEIILRISQLRNILFVQFNNIDTRTGNLELDIDKELETYLIDVYNMFIDIVSSNSNLID